MRRSVVVVVSVLVAGLGVTLSACPPSKVAPAPDCLTYVDCYLPPQNGDEKPESGYGLLAQHSDEDALSCYAGFLGQKQDGSPNNGDDIELLLAPMRRAYGADGSCWTEGYAGVGRDGAQIAADYQATCLQVCQQELLAECRRARRGETLACPALKERVDAFCAEHDDGEIDDARCPGAEGEGEGE